MQLVASDSNDPHKAIEKSLDWEHARELEIGKWSLAGTTGLIVAVATGLLKQGPTEPSNTGDATKHLPHALSAEVILTTVALACAGALLVFGARALWRAARVQRQYILTLTLLAKMIELRPFLKIALSKSESKS